MIDIDAYPFLYWDTAVTGARSSKNISVNMRHNDKILVEAQDKIYDYTTRRNRLGWTFENLMRSVGLAAGTVFGGVVGGATLGAIGTGVGRSVGEHLGNRVYGKTMHDLDFIIEDYKYRQLSNQYQMEVNTGSKSMVNELYKQSYQEEMETLRGLEQ